MIGTVSVLCLIFLRNDDDFRLVEPHGYWKTNNKENEWFDFEIYSPVENDLPGYNDFPAIAEENVLEKIVPRGNKLEDGFKAKY